jgi:hypothetical protein
MVESGLAPRSVSSSSRSVTATESIVSSRRCSPSRPSSTISRGPPLIAFAQPPKTGSFDEHLHGSIRIPEQRVSPSPSVYFKRIAVRICDLKQWSPALRWLRRTKLPPHNSWSALHYGSRLAQKIPVSTGRQNERVFLALPWPYFPREVAEIANSRVQLCDESFVFRQITSWNS